MATRGSVMSRALAAELVMLLFCLTARCGEAVWLSIPKSGTKCVSEEIQRNVVVLGHYYVVDENDPHTSPTVSSKVTSPFGNILHHQENVSHSQFAFTTEDTGSYLACFTIDSGYQQTAPITLGIDWRIGVAAKDWDSVAKKEKIEGVELNLKRLTGLVEALHEGLNYLKVKEYKMREVSEVTNSRVAWFSFMSLGVCILVSVWQISHLKRYFRKKKLI